MSGRAFPVFLYSIKGIASDKLRPEAVMEFHYTPKHGSWLNMAEIEFSAMHTSCTNRRIPDVATLKRDLAAFVLARNHAKATINWRFTSIDARIKLKHLYPSTSH